MTKYSKFIAAVFATVLSAIIAALTGDGIVTATEWTNVAIAGVGALGVFAGANVPGARYTKAILMALTAILTLLASLIVGGLTGTEVMQLVIAGLGAVGVYAVPNKPAVTV